jgi:hypothetical protein
VTELNVGAAVIVSGDVVQLQCVAVTNAGLVEEDRLARVRCLRNKAADGRDVRGVAGKRNCLTPALAPNNVRSERVRRGVVGTLVGIGGLTRSAIGGRSLVERVMTAAWSVTIAPSAGGD